METIWLQRPSGDIPWGFRLQGGREFHQPIAVQRVTPGSIASNGLDAGDMVLKIGNVTATDLSLNDAQEVIKGATNILQLTIKKGAVPPSPISPTSHPSQYSSPPQSGYSSSPYEQEADSYSFPDYRVGSGYDGRGSANSGGYNYAQGSSPYDTRQNNEYGPSGYSTLPARSGNKQSNESFRPVADPQTKYPYKATAGIQLRINPQNVQRVQDDGDIYNQQRDSPVQYQNNSQNEQFQRQMSGGSNRSDTNTYPQSYYKKPTPFTPTYNGNTETPPQLQRQTSSGSQGNTAHVATVSQPSYTANSNSYSPPSDEAPPPPPPPVNYQPEPYQRQSSHPGSYNSSPYDQRQNSYDPYQQRQQPGMYVDTADQSTPQYQRQGSRPQAYNAPPQQYQPQQNQPNYYNDRPSEPQPPPAPFQRQQSYGSQPQTPQQPSYGSQHQAPQQPSYGSQPQTPQQPSYGSQPQTPQQQYGSPYTPPQQYARQSSRDQQNQPSYPVSPPGGTGINSFEDILQPFEKFQNSNYCDKLFARDNRGDVDSGVMSDFSQSISSDTPRSTQSNFSNYSPPQTAYPRYSEPPPPPPMQHNLLQPAAAGAPPPAVSPPPPPPPPPPSDWQAPRRPPPASERSSNAGGDNQMPDKVLNTMLKNTGTQKPFSYVPTGMDLKRFKEKARQRQHRVMPRGYEGPQVENDNDVTGNNSTPERRTSDIKESEVYKMIKASDAKGKNGHVTPDLEIEDPPSCDREKMLSPPPASRGQGLSFRVLQWLTDTTEDNDQEDNVESHKPKKPRDPLLRHNSEDDEMRFSGLHTKADIPSKAFSRLNKLVISDDNQTTEDQQCNQQRDEAVGRQQTDEEDDGLPDKLSEEDMVDKRYTGANIPSRSFKALQMFTDSPDSAKTGGSGTGSPRIKVVNRAGMSPSTVQGSGTATPPRQAAPPVDHPVSDF